MTLFALRGVKLDDVGEVRQLTAQEIARGLQEGRQNVPALQQALTDSHSGRSSGTGDMLRALGGGEARQNG